MTAAELRKASTEDLLGALEHPPTSFEEYLDLHAGKDVNIVQRFIPKIEMRLLA